MKDINKEKWVNNAMDSASGISRATPPQDLILKINARLNKTDSVSTTIRFPFKKWAAAAVLLIAMNAASAVYFAGHSSKQKGGKEIYSIVGEVQVETLYTY